MMPVLLVAFLLIPSAEAVSAPVPAAVRAYVARQAGCNHWGGEDAYDAARGREIARAMQRLRCDTIDRDERLLKRRYAWDKAVLRLIDRAGDANTE